MFDPPQFWSFFILCCLISRQKHSCIRTYVHQIDAVSTDFDVPALPELIENC